MYIQRTNCIPSPFCFIVVRLVRARRGRDLFRAQGCQIFLQIPTNTYTYIYMHTEGAFHSLLFLLQFRALNELDEVQIYSGLKAARYFYRYLQVPIHIYTSIPNAHFTRFCSFYSSAPYTSSMRWRYIPTSTLLDTFIDRQISRYQYTCEKVK